MQRLEGPLLPSPAAGGAQWILVARVKVRGHEGSGTAESLLGGSGGSPTETSELAAEIQDAISEGAISFLLTVRARKPPSPRLLARHPSSRSASLPCRQEYNDDDYSGITQEYKYIVLFMVPFAGCLFLLLAAPARFSSAWGTYPDDSDMVREAPHRGDSELSRLEEETRALRGVAAAANVRRTTAMDDRTN